MIGVDTNVLVRLVVEENFEQTALAISFFDARSPASPAHISLIVIAELAWVLGKTYKFGYDRVAAFIERLLETSDIVVERSDIVKWALDQFNHAKIDFADLLIAEINRQAECEATVTFDRNAAKRISGMDLLA
ncbi:PIN domain-containing protein [uncultured Devosia sp.]|uniref:PIN domain-containing protein n=1 Tax=uncultured Devosia sp. TaxID=211434 RepID=UPI0035CC95CB